MSDKNGPKAHASLARLVISVGDLARGAVFYHQILGLNVTREDAEFMWLETAEGIEIMLHQRTAKPSDCAVAIGFFVDSLDSVFAAWRDRGGVIVAPPLLQPWGEQMAIVRDADGHLVCLSASS